MCNYIYNKSNGKKCQLYHANGNVNISLPLDKKGLCFFHSTDVRFKVEYDILEQIKRTIKWLDENSDARIYDFTDTRIGAGVSQIKVEGLVLNKEINFHKAIFFARIDFEKLETVSRLFFDSTEFRESVTFKDCSLRDIDFSYSLFNGLLIFDNTSFKDGKLILVRSEHSHHIFMIQDSYIEATISCFESIFSGIVLRNSIFKGKVSFDAAVISKQFIVDSCKFEDNVEFINTEFKVTDRGLNDKYSPIHFNEILIEKESVFNFKGKEAQGMFTAETAISFLDDLHGKIQFVNVNLNYLDAPSKEKVFSYLHTGKVIIGSGCLRYRHQEIKTIALSESNQSLVVELSQVFTNFFEEFNGINLGVEIQSRTKEKVVLIYFSDENISSAEFVKRLAVTEIEMWKLIGSEVNENNPPKNRADKFIYTMDTLINLTSLLFKVCVRIPFGRISNSDLESLLSSTNFNENRIIEIGNFKKVIIKQYNQSVLFGINNNQVISTDDKE